MIGNITQLLILYKISYNIYESEELFNTWELWFFSGFYFLFPYIFKWIFYQCINLRPSLLWTKKEALFCKIRKKININESIFTYYFWCVCGKMLLPSQEFEMQVKVKWHHISDKGNFSLHETKELIQIITKHSLFMFGVGYLKRIQSRSAVASSEKPWLPGAPRTVEHLRFREMTLQVHLRICICNSSTNLSQGWVKTANIAKKKHTVAFSRRS